MSYCTDYDIAVRSTNGSCVCQHTIGRIQKELLESFDEVNDLGGGLLSAYGKNCDWDGALTHASLTYPKYLFHTVGRGEDEDDMWSAVFLNGQMHYMDIRERE